MSTYPHDPQNFNPYPSQRHAQEDYKDSYDDLIDEYASPYAATPRHKTYAVEAPPLAPADHRRGVSQKSFSGKLSNETLNDEPPAYPPLSSIKEIDTRSFLQKFLPESLACRLYVVTVLIETTIDLAIEADLLVRVHEAEPNGSQTAKRKMPVYLSIFALAHVFQLVMAVDAVYARNTLQFICLTVFNAVFLAYAIIQINEVQVALAVASTTNTDVLNIPIKVLTTIIPIVISIAEIAYIALGWRIYHEFGWKVYKFLGADRNIKKMYGTYQIFQCLVKFDVFFWVGFSVQFIWLVLQSNDWEYYVTCAALPLSIVLLVEGHLAARHENKWMMATFMSGCVGAMVYFIYKLVKVLMFKKSDQFKLIYKTLTVFSVIAILLLLTTFVFAIMVMRNFGRGLKATMAKKDTSQHGRFGSQNPHRRAASTNLNRMSID